MTANRTLLPAVLRRSIILGFILVVAAGILPAQSFQADSESYNFYPTLTLVEGNPVWDFKTNLSRKALWGGSIDVVFRLFEDYPAWEPGVQIEFLSLGGRNDTWNGVEVTTSSALIRVNLMSRIRPMKSGMFDPFIDIVYGIDINSTNTSYEIVDRATFYDKFFYGAEDQTEKVDVRNFNDYTPNVGVGIGMVINRLVTLQVQYNYCPKVEFIDAQDVSVVNNTVMYGRSSSSIQMITVRLGVSLEKIFIP